MPTPRRTVDGLLRSVIGNSMGEVVSKARLLTGIESRVVGGERGSNQKTPHGRVWIFSGRIQSVRALARVTVCSNGQATFLL